MSVALTFAHHQNYRLTHCGKGITVRLTAKKKRLSPVLKEPLPRVLINIPCLDLFESKWSERAPRHLKIRSLQRHRNVASKQLTLQLNK